MEHADDLPVPPALAKERRRLLTVLLAPLGFLMAIAVLQAVLAVAFGVSEFFCLCSGVALAAPMVVVAAFGLRNQTSRWRRRLEPLAYEACLYCGYPRRGLPEGRPCPECGMPHDDDLARRAWRRHLYAEPHRTESAD